MKLKTRFQDNNFELGEVVKAKVTTYYNEDKVVVMADTVRGSISRFEYNSIKEFTDHWEDAPEEPKDVWWLDNEGNVNHANLKGVEGFEKNILIGNYFETKEEAEKAVEKLKALKRLKDKGFRFTKWQYDITNQKYIITMEEKDFEELVVGEKRDDLDLLFSGEDD